MILEDKLGPDAVLTSLAHKYPRRRHASAHGRCQKNLLAHHGSQSLRPRVWRGDTARPCEAPTASLPDLPQFSTVIAGYSLDAWHLKVDTQPTKLRFN
jgi:hypothetical protein